MNRKSKRSELSQLRPFPFVALSVFLLCLVRHGERRRCPLGDEPHELHEGIRRDGVELAADRDPDRAVPLGDASPPPAGDAAVVRPDEARRGLRDVLSGDGQRRAILPVLPAEPFHALANDDSV